MRSLGARDREANAFRTRNQLPDQLGPFDFQTMTGAVVRAEPDLRSHRFDHCRMIVTKYQRAVSAQIIYIFIAIDIPLSRALRPLNVNRMRFEITSDVRDAIWQR